MNINTGKTISEIAHIKQSIANILTTPIGSRIMRRNYGSRLFKKIDSPINGELVAEIPCKKNSYEADFSKMIDYDLIKNN